MLFSYTKVAPKPQALQNVVKCERVYLFCFMPIMMMPKQPDGNVGKWSSPSFPAMPDFGTYEDNYRSFMPTVAALLRPLAVYQALAALPVLWPLRCCCSAAATPLGGPGGIANAVAIVAALVGAVAAYGVAESDSESDSDASSHSGDQGFGDEI